MKYLLLAYGDEAKCNQLSQAEMAALGQKCSAFDAELHATGRVVSGGSLEWASKSLRLKGGKLSITDGPFVDTKEVVGGLVILGGISLLAYGRGRRAGQPCRPRRLSGRPRETISAGTSESDRDDLPS